MFFIDLPDSLLSVVFSEWIDTKDLVKLDSSLTNENSRRDFFVALSSEMTSFAGIANIGIYHKSFAKQYKWAKMRHLAFNTLLEGTSRIIANNFSNLDLLKKTSLLKVHVSEDVNIIINLCPNLTILTFGSNSMDVSNLELILPKIKSNIWKKLQVISNVPFKTVPHLTKYCTQLMEIEIMCKAIVYRKEEDDEESYGSSSFEEKEIIELERSDSDKSIHMYEVLSSLTKCNPNLKRITFLASGDCSAIDISEIPDLSSFNFDYVKFCAQDANKYYLRTFPSATTVKMSFDQDEWYPALANGDDEEEEWYDCSYDKKTNCITIAIMFGCDEMHPAKIFGTIAVQITPATTTLVFNYMHMCCETFDLWDAIEKRSLLTCIHINGVGTKEFNVFMREFHGLCGSYKDKLLEQKRSFSIFADNKLVFCVEKGMVTLCDVVDKVIDSDDESY